MRPRTGPFLALLCFASMRPAWAEDVLVAVAASFMPPMQALAAAFEASNEHTVALVSGSTGGLYAQIVNGAPFDLFVAADEERPRLLEQTGHGIAGTRATIALGRLVLYSRDPAFAGALQLDKLQSPLVRHVAIANPRVAPYGTAARETLEALGLWDSLEPKLVRGENVAQTFAMIATGNAELGFVALAQVLAADGTVGSQLIVPEAYYSPIRHDVILLARARNNRGALALRESLFSPRAREIIRTHGYATEASQTP